jgi:hypothetical protein
LPVLIGIAVLVALALARAGEIRERAEAGLGEGMPAREAALARGFVLGDDDGLDQPTKEDFIRAGLSHLTAVSGENVTLLALLALPVLAAFGAANVAALRVGVGGRGDAGRRPECGGQRRLAAELRGRARDPAPRRPDPRVAARPTRSGSSTSPGGG